MVGALLSRGLILDRVTYSIAKTDAALNCIWRNEPDGRSVLLFITPAGFDAIGVEPATEPEAVVQYRFNEGTNSAAEPASGAPTGADEAPAEPAPKKRGGWKKGALAATEAAGAAVLGRRLNRRAPSS